jgi:hypothetical protein
LDVQLYQLMYDGDDPPASPKPVAASLKGSWEASRAGKRFMSKINPSLSRMKQHDRDLILFLATRVAKNRKQR